MDSQKEIIEKLFSIINGSLADFRKELSALARNVHELEKLEVRDYAQLETHIRRTEAAENRLEFVENKLNEEIKELHSDFDNFKIEITNNISNVKTTVTGWKANIHMIGWIVVTAISVISLVTRFF